MLFICLIGNISGLSTLSGDVPKYERLDTIP